MSARRYFDPNPKDLARVIAAWNRSWSIPGEVECQPCGNLSCAYNTQAGQLRIELHNVRGFLGVFSVTPKRVTFLSQSKP